MGYIIAVVSVMLLVLIFAFRKPKPAEADAEFKRLEDLLLVVDDAITPTGCLATYIYGAVDSTDPRYNRTSLSDYFHLLLCTDARKEFGACWPVYCPGLSNAKTGADEASLQLWQITDQILESGKGPVRILKVRLCDMEHVRRAMARSQAQE